MAKISNTRLTQDLLHYKRIGIDSMCFIYQFADNPRYSPLTHTLFTLMEQKKIAAVTSTVSVVEAFVQPEIKHDEFLLLEYEKFFTHLPNLEIVELDWHVARLAAKLRATYKSLKTPDTIQVAATLLKSYKAFLTNDEKLKQIKEVKVLQLDNYIE